MLYGHIFRITANLWHVTNGFPVSVMILYTFAFYEDITFFDYIKCKDAFNECCFSATVGSD